MTGPTFLDTLTTAAADADAAEANFRTAAALSHQRLSALCPLAAFYFRGATIWEWSARGSVLTEENACLIGQSDVYGAP